MHPFNHNVFIIKFGWDYVLKIFFYGILTTDNKTDHGFILMKCCLFLQIWVFRTALMIYDFNIRFFRSICKLNCGWINEQLCIYSPSKFAGVWKALADWLVWYFYSFSQFPWQVTDGCIWGQQSSSVTTVLVWYFSIDLSLNLQILVIFQSAMNS